MRALFLTLLALCLAACSWAQPLEGPFTIVELDSQAAVGKHILAVGDGDTAFVFCENRPTGQTMLVSWGSYSFASRELLHPVESLGEAGGWRHELHDAMILEDGSCAAVMYRVAPSESQTSETILFRLSTAVVSDWYVLFSGYHIYPCWFSCFDLVSTRLAPRIGGGFLVIGAVASRFQAGYDEVDFNPHFWAFSDAGNLADWQGSHFPQTLWGSENNWAVSLAPDTLLLLTTGVGWGDSHLGRCFPSDSAYTDTTMECTIHPVGFMRTAGGHLLAASGHGYGAEADGMYELYEDGACAILGGFGSAVAAEAIALYPGFGFAALTRDSSGLMLARFDTNGTEVASRGMMLWPESDYEIVSAYCTIAPDGRVFVQCMEHSLAVNSRYRLRVASVGWDTPLGTEDRDFILHPSVFGLLAFPNPFNSALKIEYTLPRAGNVNLSVFNVLGQKVETLLDARVESGTHAITWNPDCAGGLYFVALKTESATRTTKVLYIR